jgi:hypothetical protein
VQPRRPRWCSPKCHSRRSFRGQHHFWRSSCAVGIPTRRFERTRSTLPVNSIFLVGFRSAHRTSHNLCSTEFARDALADASVAADLRVGDPSAFFAGKQSGDARNVARLADAQRRALLIAVLELLGQIAKLLRLYGARQNAVNCDSAWSELCGKDPRERLHRSLTTGVSRAKWGQDYSYHR